ncbi:histidine phosphatase family protein [Gryllotalpicola sp.]|uniref:histidine phosphatase family protein n=1 Tax=Gryllotalpicola sp. TaxID=1932787 RepID=UPI002636A9B8|nr:histidine phosphatase family protein [Gryllotalpicola sp.]
MSGTAGDAMLVLVRHGQTEWAKNGWHTGSSDIPLTAVGEDEARAVGDVLSGHRFGLALTSPLQRARRTAALAGFPHAGVDPNLAEWDYGAYEGLTSEQIAAEHGGLWNLWRDGVPAGRTPGENAIAVRRRADAVLVRAVEVMRRGEDALLFAHGHLLRAIGAAWLELEPEDGAAFSLATGTVSVLGFEHGRAVVKRWNCTPGILALPES